MTGAAKTYIDKTVCPRCGYVRGVTRQKRVAGRKVRTWCCRCRKGVQMIAGSVKP